MKTKKLISFLKGLDSYGTKKDIEVMDEIIQKLRQLDDMKQLIGDLLDTTNAIDELFELVYFGKDEIKNFQKGDINYERGFEEYDNKHRIGA